MFTNPMWTCPACRESFLWHLKTTHEETCKPAPPEPVPPVELDPESEESRVYHWRVARFQAEGCSEVEAHLLASSRADWHDLHRLVADKGCPVTTAARLLID